jgi:hypothetical protein
MNYLAEYQGYTVNFRTKQFQREDEHGNVTLTIDFRSEFGTTMLIGFANYMLETIYNGPFAKDLTIIRYKKTKKGGEQNV